MIKNIVACLVAAAAIVTAAESSRRPKASSNVAASLASLGAEPGQPVGRDAPVVARDDGPCGCWDDQAPELVPMQGGGDAGSGTVVPAVKITAKQIADALHECIVELAEIVNSQHWSALKLKQILAALNQPELSRLRSEQREIVLRIITMLTLLENRFRFKGCGVIAPDTQLP